MEWNGRQVYERMNFGARDKRQLFAIHI